MVNEIIELVGNYDFPTRILLSSTGPIFNQGSLKKYSPSTRSLTTLRMALTSTTGLRFKVLLDYLRLISNPDSEEGDEALRSVINIPNRYIGRKFMQELEEFSAKKNFHLYQGLKSMGIDLPYVRKNVKELIGFLDPLIDYANNMTPSEIIGTLRSGLDYDRYCFR